MKHVDVESKEQKVFSGHEAPVLSVALHPNEQFIVSRINDTLFHGHGMEFAAALQSSLTEYYRQCCGIYSFIYSFIYYVQYFVHRVVHAFVHTFCHRV